MQVKYFDVGDGEMMALPEPELADGEWPKEFAFFGIIGCAFGCASFISAALALDVPIS